MKDLTDPTNRDSVPAILTPGEYVLNKEATEMYGPIIEQMNENGLAARTEGNMGVLSLNTGGSIVTGDPTQRLLDKIAIAEGTLRDGYSGYNTTYGYGKYVKPNKPLTEMTLGEVYEYQKKLIKATKGEIPGGK